MADHTRPVIGIDIGGTHMRAAVIGPDGRILTREDHKSSRDPEAMLALVIEVIGRLSAGKAPLIGIGVPSQVVAETREIRAGGYVFLGGINFSERVEAATGARVAVENDGTMALLGEQAHGAAAGLSTVVMLTIGTGIGGAVMERGRVLRGRGTAGELGHVAVAVGGAECICGKRGCVETFSSGTAFARHLALAGLPEDTRIEALLARPHDPLAAGVIRAFAAPLRTAIDTLIAVMNPDCVVLGGGLGAGAVAALATVPPLQSWFDAPVVAARLGADAGLIGAAIAAGQRLPQ